MTHDQVADALRRNNEHGIHDPTELHGIIPSIDDAYSVPLGLLERFERAGERQAVLNVAPTLEVIEKRHVARLDMALAIADNAQQKAFVTGTAVPMGVLEDAVEAKLTSLGSVTAKFR